MENLHQKLLILRLAVQNYNQLASSITSVDAYAFYNTAITQMMYTNNLTTLGDYSFAYSKLTSVIIPASVVSENIGSNVFEGCKFLTSVIFLNKGLGDMMFIDCTGLTAIILPDGVTSIGAYAFQNCENLVTVSVPNSVLTIAEGAFSNCIKIADLTLPFIGESRGSTLEKGLFGYIFGYNENLTYLTRQYYDGDPTDETNTSFKDYNIPTTLNSIIITDESLVSYGAFMNCVLKSITLPTPMEDKPTRWESLPVT